MFYNELIDKCEWAHHGAHSYLLIQKNAIKSVTRALGNYYLDNVPNPNNGLKWTVIRHPMDRMISGLAFDIKLNPKIHETYIIDNLQNSLYGLMSPVFRSDIHKENHTYLQSNYLINNPIDFYVDINDLNTFLKCNFDYDASGNIDEDGSREYKGKAKELIHRFGQQRMEDLLAFDTHIYNKIKTSGNIWKWQHGKVFL